jgi:hypothetical protein
MLTNHTRLTRDIIGSRLRQEDHRIQTQDDNQRRSNVTQ